MTPEELRFQQQRMDDQGRQLMLGAAHAQLELRLARVERRMRQIESLIGQAGSLSAEVIEETAEIRRCFGHLGRPAPP